MKKKDLNSKLNRAPLLDKEGCSRLEDENAVVDHAKPPHSKNIHTLPHLKTFRTHLRNNLTPAEAFLWKQIQRSKLEGRKFRRQHSIGNYIVDFYCSSEQLAIELDGNGHYEANQQLYDEERDLFLSYFNITVVRFENKQVFDNLEGVFNEIRSHFKE
jgi:very-short-patch-repair endonuclease